MLDPVDASEVDISGGKVIRTYGDGEFEEYRVARIVSDGCERYSGFDDRRCCSDDNEEPCSLSASKCEFRIAENSLEFIELFRASDEVELTIERSLDNLARSSLPAKC